MRTFWKVFRKPVFFITLIVLVIIYTAYFLHKRTYCKNINELTERSSMVDLASFFNAFFSDSLQHPNNIGELYTYFSTDSLHLGRVKQLMGDPFSMFNQDFLYVPIYNKNNSLREGYILISAGIDSKINVSLPDTVYFETVSEFEFYNNIEIATELKFRVYENEYSLIDFFFGQKDLLIEYTNGVNIFINNALNRAFTPTELFDNLYPKGFSRLDCCVVGKVTMITGNLIEIADEKTKTIFSLYRGGTKRVNVNDSVKIVGQFRNRLDSNDRIVYLDYGIVLD